MEIPFRAFPDILTFRYMQQIANPQVFVGFESQFCSCRVLLVTWSRANATQAQGGDLP
jgi:hypothetical protein